MKLFEYKSVIFTGTFDIDEEFNKLGGEGGISKGDSGCQNCAVEFIWEEEV